MTTPLLVKLKQILHQTDWFTFADVDAKDLKIGHSGEWGIGSSYLMSDFWVVALSDNEKAAGKGK